MVESLMSSGVAGGVAGGLASGLLVGALSSKKGRKAATSAAKIGGAALVGGLAWKAYQSYRDRQGEAPPSPPAAGAAGEPAWAALSREGFLPEHADEKARRNMLVLRAMISAAHADGHIDEAERGRIFERIEAMGLAPAEKGRLFDELLSPRPVAALVSEVDCPEVGAEMYMAALVTVDPREDAAARFLERFAAGLGLPPALVAEMHEHVMREYGIALGFRPEVSPSALVANG